MRYFQYELINDEKTNAIYVGRYLRYENSCIDNKRKIRRKLLFSLPFPAGI